jgi:SM-20-related protein
MEVFKSLCDSLANQGWVYSDLLLPSTSLKAWRNLALENLDQGQFRSAQVASGSHPQVRSDRIYWLEESVSNNQTIFQTLQSWKKEICQGLLISAPDIEAHFAYYGPGNSYEKHCDQPKNSQARVITFVIYLHEKWHHEMGGELVIFKDQFDEEGIKIEPLPGRVVFFLSDEVWHQVQESRFHRLSLTGWFRHP